METDTGRAVRWTNAAIDDLRFWKITKAEWKAIRAEVERIAQVKSIRLDAAVCSVAQCDHEWMRLKITRPSQIRVFFTEEGQPPKIVIQAVLHRSERTYDIAQILFKKAV